MILALFAIGLVLSVLWTLLTRAVAAGRPLQAGALTFFLDAAVIGTTWLVIDARSVWGLLAYCLGGAIGTALACWPKQRKKRVLPWFVEEIWDELGRKQRP